jgi:hypothetical protein
MYFIFPVSNKNFSWQSEINGLSEIDSLKQRISELKTENDKIRAENNKFFIFFLVKVADHWSGCHVKFQPGAPAK